MAPMMLRVPVAVVCDECEAAFEAAYDLELNTMADGKGRFQTELRHIRTDFADFLGEEGWVVYSSRCLCPDCAEAQGASAPMPMDALSLIREAGQLFRSGRPAALSKGHAEDTVPDDSEERK